MECFRLKLNTMTMLDAAGRGPPLMSVHVNRTYDACARICHPPSLLKVRGVAHSYLQG